MALEGEGLPGNIPPEYLLFFTDPNRKGYFDSREIPEVTKFLGAETGLAASTLKIVRKHHNFEPVNLPESARNSRSGMDTLFRQTFETNELEGFVIAVENPKNPSRDANYIAVVTHSDGKVNLPLLENSLTTSTVAIDIAAGLNSSPSPSFDMIQPDLTSDVNGLMAEGTLDGFSNLAFILSNALVGRKVFSNVSDEEISLTQNELIKQAESNLLLSALVNYWIETHIEDYGIKVYSSS